MARRLGRNRRGRAGLRGGSDRRGAGSLLAVVFTLGQAGHARPPERGLLTALAIGSVVLAWLSVHTVYLLRYARDDYSPPQGGIDFHGEAPDYVDFRLPSR